MTLYTIVVGRCPFVAPNIAVHPATPSLNSLPTCSKGHSMARPALLNGEVVAVGRCAGDVPTHRRRRPAVRRPNFGRQQPPIGAAVQTGPRPNNPSSHGYSLVLAVCLWPTDTRCLTIGEFRTSESFVGF